MTLKKRLIYEGKAKKVFEHEDLDKVVIEFKDDATAFNSLKKAKFKGKGELNCQISINIFSMFVNTLHTKFTKSLGSSHNISWPYGFVARY